MAINKVSNFSDLIQRVTASCFLHPLAGGRHQSDEISTDDDVQKTQSEGEEEEERERGLRHSGEPEAWAGSFEDSKGVMEMEMLIGEVFEAVSAMKRTYVSLQEAHCPWDPDKMRVCDLAVVAELRRLGVLRERFRRRSGGGIGRERGRRVVGATLREVVAPYEAVVEELKREVKVKEAEVENLREKLRMAASISGGSGGGGKKGRSHHQSKRRVSCSSQTPTGKFSPLFSS